MKCICEKLFGFSSKIRSAEIPKQKRAEIMIWHLATCLNATQTQITYVKNRTVGGDYSTRM